MTGLGTLEPLARAGFFVKGVLYLVIGTLAIQVAARAGGRVTGTRGALLTVLGQPFGRMLLLAAAIGLFGYAAWRIVQGVLDPERYGRGWKGIAMRIGFVARGVMHAALGWQALRLHRGLSASSGAAERTVARELLAWPYRRVGARPRGARPDRLRHRADPRGLHRPARARARREPAAARRRRWAVHVSRFGVAARAVVFIVLGWSAVVAGWSRDASEVSTTAASLRTLGSQPGELGRWLLALAAAGFIAYGFYQIVHARYLRIRLEA